MPKTVESILASHHAAAERRERGKPVWDRRLRIKHLLSSDSSNERAKTVGAEIAATLRGSSWMKADEKDVQEQGGEAEVAALARAFAKVTTLSQLNKRLSDLYDLADADRVWIY